MSRPIFLSLFVFFVFPEYGHGNPQTSPSLADEINALLLHKSVAGGRFSLMVAPVDGGKPLYTNNSNLRLHPASNTKLFTTATALSMLGPAYRWQTKLVTDAFVDGIAENIYLVGRGDPKFVSESLWKMVDDARNRGLKKVDGDVIVDDTYFTPQRMAPGFDDKDQDSAYRAATGAMSLNFNSFVAELRPGKAVGQPARITVRPNSGFVKITNRSKTVSRGRERLRASAQQWNDRTELIVDGRIPLGHRGIVIRKRLDNPPLNAGYAARYFLRRAGIEVTGEVRTGAVPVKVETLARSTSPALSSVVSDVNKLSNNFMAEHLVRTMGAESGGSGDWKSGAQVVSEFLKRELQIDGFRYVNGSGLFGNTAFSARDIVKLLRHMYRKKTIFPEFISSLAIGSTDGTLSRRMKRVEGAQVRAKTGTLDGVVCLSGYLILESGQTFAFSLLMNDLPGRPWSIWKIQDQIIETVTRHLTGRKRGKE